MVTVKEINGDGEIYKVGDEILYDGLTFEGKICSSALASIFPHTYALAWGAEFFGTRRKTLAPGPVPAGAR